MDLSFLTNPAVIQLVGTLGGVLIGAGVTWLGLRAQYRMKEMELKETASLRGKELLFQTYQGKVERIPKDIGALGGGFGGILGLYAGGDEEDRQKLNSTLFAVAKESVALLREHLAELEEARKKVGLGDSSPVQIQTAKDFLALDMEGEKSQDEMQRIVIGLAKTTAIIPSLWQDVLEAESKALFGDFAQGTKLLRS